jgi:hypothetical protein
MDEFYLLVDDNVLKHLMKLLLLFRIFFHTNEIIHHIVFQIHYKIHDEQKDHLMM